MALAVRLQTRFRQIERPLGLGIAHLHIVHVSVYADRQVGRQRPRRGRPSGQAGVFVFELEEHGDGGVLNVQIVLPGLEIGKHGGKRRRDGHDLEAFIDQALVPELLDHPPDRLHVPSVHGLVVVVEIHPAPQPRDGVAPFGHVAFDDGATFGVVARHAKFGDGLLGRHAERLVDFLFDGQAVAIPAKAPLHVAPLHRPVARHHVFQHRRHQIAVVGQTCRKRRPVVEDVGLGVPRGV